MGLEVEAEGPTPPGAGSAQEPPEGQPAPQELDNLAASRNCKKLRFWRLVTALLALTLVGLVCHLGEIWFGPSATRPAMDHNPFKLLDGQLRVTDGTIALFPPSDPQVEIGENFVNSAILEAARWYGKYFADSSVPGYEPAIFGVSAIQLGVFPTLCLPEDIGTDFRYAFFCKDEHTVWVPHTTLLVGVWQPEELGLEPGTETLQYGPRFAAAAVGVFAYSSALADHLATGSGGHMTPLHRRHDGLVAACFTGAWADTGRNLSALTTRAAIGAIKKYAEPRLLRHSRHDLEVAFKLGQDTRRPLACLETYWPWNTPPSVRPAASPARQAGQPSGAPWLVHG